jgi:hypothetical protein
VIVVVVDFFYAFSTFLSVLGNGLPGRSVRYKILDMTSKSKTVSKSVQTHFDHGLVASSFHMCLFCIVLRY